MDPLEITDPSGTKPIALTVAVHTSTSVLVKSGSTVAETSPKLMHDATTLEASWARNVIITDCDLLAVSSTGYTVLYFGYGYSETSTRLGPDVEFKAGRIADT